METKKSKLPRKEKKQIKNYISERYLFGYPTKLIRIGRYKNKNKVKKIVFYIWYKLVIK